MLDVQKCPTSVQYAFMYYLINYSLKIGNITWLWGSYIGDKQTLKQGLYMWDSVEKDQTNFANAYSCMH